MENYKGVVIEKSGKEWAARVNDLLILDKKISEVKRLIDEELANNPEDTYQATYNAAPKAVKALIDKYGDDSDYKKLEAMAKKLEKLGYKLDYGLDGQITGLEKMEDCDTCDHGKKSNKVTAKNTVDLIKEAASLGFKKVKVTFIPAYEEKLHSGLKNKDLVTDLKKSKVSIFDVIEESSDIVDLSKSRKDVISMEYTNESEGEKEEKNPALIPFPEFMSRVDLDEIGNNRVEILLNFSNGEKLTIGNIENSSSEDNFLEYNHLQLEKFQMNAIDKALKENISVPKEVIDYYFGEKSRHYEVYGTHPTWMKKHISSKKEEPVSESFSDCLTRNGINLEKDNHRFEVGTKIKDNVAGTTTQVQEIREKDILLSYLSALGHGEPVRFNVTYSKLIDEFAAGNITVDGFDKEEKMEFARVLNAVQGCLEKEKLKIENEKLKENSDELTSIKQLIPDAFNKPFYLQWEAFHTGSKDFRVGKVTYNKDGFNFTIQDSKKGVKPLVVSDKKLISMINNGDFTTLTESEYIEESKGFEKPKFTSTDSMIEFVLSKAENKGLLKSGKYGNSEAGVVAYIKDKKKENPNAPLSIYGVNSNDIVKYIYNKYAEDKFDFQEKYGVEFTRQVDRAIDKMIEREIGSQLKETDNKETIAGLKTLLSLTTDKEEKKKIRAEIKALK